MPSASPTDCRPFSAGPSPTTAGWSVQLDLPSLEATEALGARLAALLADGGVVLLSGDLGAGKSTLARAIVRAATGDPERDVASPSYTLINRHDTGDREIWHADLYRLAGPEEAEELGLDDAAPKALVLVEWPDRLADRLPARRLEVAIRPSAAPDARRVRVLAIGAEWPMFGAPDGWHVVVS